MVSLQMVKREHYLGLYPKRRDSEFSIAFSAVKNLYYFLSILNNFNDLLSKNHEIGTKECDLFSINRWDDDKNDSVNLIC